VPNSLIMKIKVGGGRHIEFLGNVNIFGLDVDVCTKFEMTHHDLRRLPSDQKRNQKLVPVTLSNEF